MDIETKNEFEKLKNELQEIKQLTLLNTKRVLTMNDVALLTGLSKSHIYRLVCYKHIPHYKQGGKITYFEKNEIEDWMLSRRIKTTQEIDEEATGYVITSRRKGAIA
jgi:excisionase family DNA binding protein